MAALNFPDTPTTGELYGSAGTVWRWDGARWASTAGASGARGQVAYNQLLTNTTGIVGTAVDVGMSVAFTADPTRTYRITLVGAVQSTVTGDVSVSTLSWTGTGAQGTQHVMSLQPAATMSTLTWSSVQTGLSGPMTCRATCRRSSASTGTLTWGGSLSVPSFILVEDITYEAGSAGPGYPPAHKGDELTATVLEYVPTGAGDYGAAAWGGWVWLGNVTIPTWATQAAINLNIVGMIAPSTVPCNHFLRMVLGTHIGSPLGRADYYTLNQRFSTSWADLISLTSTGLQTLKIEVYTAAGTLRADTSTYFTAMVIFR